MTGLAPIVFAVVLSAAALWLGWIVNDEDRTARVRRWNEGDGDV